MTRKPIRESLGIVRSVFRRDLLGFFLPWMILFITELPLCGKYGRGLSGLWSTLWQLLKHPTWASRFPLHRVVGVSLFVVGLTIMIVSQVTLWKNYSGLVLIRRSHRLITHGIYRFTRNPICLGALIVFFGLPVFAASVAAFLVALAQIRIFLYRISLEEELLGAHFGEEYEAYRRSTRKLIPFVY